MLQWLALSLHTKRVLASNPPGLGAFLCGFCMYGIRHVRVRSVRLPPSTAPQSFLIMAERIYLTTEWSSSLLILGVSRPLVSHNVTIYNALAPCETGVCTVSY